MKGVELFKRISPKQWVILLAAFVLLIGLLLRPKHMAEAVDLEPFTRQPRYGVQELRSWGQGQISLVDAPINMEGYRIYCYKLDEKLLQQYIAMLQQNGFTLAGEHHQSSFLGSYQSYGLICDAAGDVATKEMMYTDIQCHVNIWKESSKWRVEVVDGITLWDMGLRFDGSEASVLPSGGSLGAALKRAFGQYQTGDGRMKTGLDKATVLKDDKKEQTAATWRRSGAKIYVTVECAEDLSVEIVFNEKEVRQGDIFLLSSAEDRPVTVKLTARDKKITAQQEGAAVFRSIALQIMYLSEDNDVVLYLYAEPMDKNNFPTTVELLCAINTTPQEQAGQGGNSGGNWWDDDDEPFRPDHSKLDCLTCKGSGDCTTCGGDGYTGFGSATAGCRRCHGDGNCTTCGGSGKR